MKMYFVVVEVHFDECLSGELSADSPGAGAVVVK